MMVEADVKAVVRTYCGVLSIIFIVAAVGSLKVVIFSLLII